MATNHLNQLFSLENQIKAKETELKNLKSEHDKIMNVVLSSGKLENRYYQVVSKSRAGDRVIQINLLREKYPEVYEKCRIESVKVTDAAKLLGDDLISEVSIKKPDTVSYWVVKKESSIVEVA